MYYTEWRMSGVCRQINYHSGYDRHFPLANHDDVNNNNYDELMAVWLGYGSTCTRLGNYTSSWIGWLVQKVQQQPPLRYKYISEFAYVVLDHS